MTNFKNLNLNEKILQALEKKGYTDPTPIQLQAIPHILEGKDILGIAQTGTGKTAAFSLPILHNLAKNPKSAKSGCVRVLILTPTRELASQIADNIQLYGKDLGLRHAVIFGGVSERPQIAALQAGVDILIATPGRLLDLTNQGYIRYMQLEVLVLDEADRMLDMGFINDIKKIIQKIPPKRQTLFFSATMPDTITDLAHSILKDPVKVEVTPQSTTVERIAQKVLMVEKSNKPSLLKRILKDENATSVLVFSKTKHGANKIVEFLEKNSIQVEAIHGNKSQGAREKALATFRAGKIKVLVATDIAARGIDIPAISHVINYDIPLDPESYVHRIGRTARAGLEGIAISFCDPSEIKFLREVEKVIKSKIPVDETHAFHGVVAAPMNRDFSSSRNRERNSSHPRSHSSSQRSGFSENRNRRFSSDYSRDDDRRTSRRDENFGERKISGDRKTEKKLFGIFSFGKKKSDSHMKIKREDGIRDDKRQTGASSRFKVEGAKKKSFGFGEWFGKKSDSRDFAIRDSSKRSDRRGDDRRENSDFSTRRKASDSERSYASSLGNTGRRFNSSNRDRAGSLNGRSRSGANNAGKKW